MVAVIIPAYERPEKLEKALNSLASQTLDTFVIVIVDDCSKKPLQSTVNVPKTKYPIVWLYNTSNMGPGLSRQRGLNWAYTQNHIDYIMFMDSDDMMLPNGVGILYKTITENNAEVVSSSLITALSGYSESSFGENIKTFCHGKIYNKKFLQENNITFIKETFTNEDLCFNNKVLLLAKKYLQIKNQTYVYMQHNDSITSNNKSFNYFRVHTIDFIEATYQTIKFANDNKEKIHSLQEHMFVDVLKCYNLYQVAMQINKEVTITYKEKIKYMLNHPLVKIFFKNNEYLQKHKNEVHFYEIYDGTLYYFEQSFKSWMEEMSK